MIQHPRRHSIDQLPISRFIRGSIYSESDTRLRIDSSLCLEAFAHEERPSLVYTFWEVLTLKVTLHVSTRYRINNSYPHRA